MAHQLQLNIPFIFSNDYKYINGKMIKLKVQTSNNNSSMWNAVSSKQNTILLLNINIIFHLDEHAL